MGGGAKKGGLAFLSKKEWHTGNRKNIERVLIAETAERRRAEEDEKIRAELAERRRVEELRRMQEKAGLITNTHAPEINWIYSGAGAGAAAGMGGAMTTQDAQLKEEYLLGKEVKLSGASISERLREEVNNVGMLTTTKAEISKSEMTALLRDDPLMAMVKKEQSARDDIINNPYKMARLRRAAALLALESGAEIPDSLRAEIDQLKTSVNGDRNTRVKEEKHEKKDKKDKKERKNRNDKVKEKKDEKERRRSRSSSPSRARSRTPTQSRSSKLNSSSFSEKDRYSSSRKRTRSSSRSRSGSRSPRRRTRSRSRSKSPHHSYRSRYRSESRDRKRSRRSNSNSRDKSPERKESHRGNKDPVKNDHIKRETLSSPGVKYESSSNVTNTSSITDTNESNSSILGSDANTIVDVKSKNEALKAVITKARALADQKVQEALNSMTKTATTTATATVKTELEHSATTTQVSLVTGEPLSSANISKNTETADMAKKAAEKQHLQIQLKQKLQQERERQHQQQLEVSIKKKYGTKSKAGLTFLASFFTTPTRLSDSISAVSSSVNVVKREEFRNDKRNDRYDGHDGYGRRTNSRESTTSSSQFKDSYENDKRHERRDNRRENERDIPRNDKRRDSGRDDRYDERYDSRRDDRYNDRHDNRYNDRYNHRHNDRYRRYDKEREDNYSRYPRDQGRDRDGDRDSSRDRDRNSSRDRERRYRDSGRRDTTRDQLHPSQNQAIRDDKPQRTSSSTLAPSSSSSTTHSRFAPVTAAFTTNTISTLSSSSQSQLQSHRRPYIRGSDTSTTSTLTAEQRERRIHEMLEAGATEAQEAASRLAQHEAAYRLEEKTFIQGQITAHSEFGQLSSAPRFIQQMNREMVLGDKALEQRRQSAKNAYNRQGGSIDDGDDEK